MWMGSLSGVVSRGEDEEDGHTGQGSHDPPLFHPHIFGI